MLTPPPSSRTHADLAVLIDDRAAHLPPTADQAASYAASREAAIAAQREATLASEQRRKEVMEARHAGEIAAKRREKEEKRRRRGEEEKRAEAQAQAGQAGEENEGQAEGEGEGPSRIEVEVPPLREGAATTGPPTGARGLAAPPAAAAAATASTPTSHQQPSPLPAPAPPPTRDLSTVAYTIIIEPRSSSLAWYDASLPRATYTTLDAAHEVQVWSYPQTPLQEARCRVFEDLWRRGYYMGGGLRFGGDFLVYPGACFGSLRRRLPFPPLVVTPSARRTHPPTD